MSKIKQKTGFCFEKKTQKAARIFFGAGYISDISINNFDKK